MVNLVAFILLNDAIIKWQRDGNLRLWNYQNTVGGANLTNYRNLKTKKQLGELGLFPLKPSGVIETRKHDVFLYDSTNPDLPSKRKPSPKQSENPCSQPPQSQTKIALNGSIEGENQYTQRF
jgi:hypothetical protein